jgi:hypothetical protein
MKPRFISKKVFKVAKSKRLLTANKPLKNIKFIKNFTSLFSFKRNSQKTHIFANFWLPHQQMGSMAGTFPLPDFKSSYTITHRNFVRIGDKHFFRKNHGSLPSIKFAPGKNI